MTDLEKIIVQVDTLLEVAAIMRRWGAVPAADLSPAGRPVELLPQQRLANEIDYKICMLRSRLKQLKRDVAIAL